MARTQTIVRTLCHFDELSDEAKEKARDWWRECENQDTDTSCTYEDAATIADLLGIDLRTRPVKLMNGSTRFDPCIWYSGFSSQGDGACFEGTYRYRKGALAAVKAHAPTDTKLHQIAKDLQDAQRKAFYCLTASCSHSGRYYHSGCMSVSVDLESEHYIDPTCEAEEDIRDALRAFADWIYSQLEAEYEYRMSDENVDESIRLNEYEFTEDGGPA
ncbi:antitoxin of toxin-antitoxin stability system [Thalassobaculum sp. OXR-137]|uniref:antitoxin of toxin-antitoxin stability system n=1 Tax=Thalassobaculum sp. OXR-137 TaxID=3100173 RepID=UPI002AC8B70E|nr:antitoxin of toxin-antitoxin stability system [Thalassobaculum sp. OXR-137]WPZ36724.1 antitoxin of toxin-antitoxin stability system [Thalassobaculum sp. OXR-137]